jgi:mannose-6-phosphate isomerase
MMTPIRFCPTYQTYVWGGDRIHLLYPQKLCPPRTAESWEISDRAEGMSLAIDETHRGKTLATLVTEMGEALLGEGKSGSKFPLLVKLIDAKEALSIQVHPDAATARKFDAEPKTEMWLALAKSFVYVGVREGISLTEIEVALREGTLAGCLKQIWLEPGEVVFIPAGTLHAIGAGSLLLEVQQNSNTTYRLYDWGRVGKEGALRPLHLKEGLASLHLHPLGAGKQKPPEWVQGDGYRQAALLHCPFFVVNRVEVEGLYAPILDPTSFRIYFCQRGSGVLQADGGSEPLEEGDFLLVPAAAKKVELRGNFQVIEILPK